MFAPQKAGQSRRTIVITLYHNHKKNSRSEN